MMLDVESNGYDAGQAGRWDKVSLRLDDEAGSMDHTSECTAEQYADLGSSGGSDTDDGCLDRVSSDIVLDDGAASDDSLTAAAEGAQGDDDYVIAPRRALASLAARRLMGRGRSAIRQAALDVIMQDEAIMEHPLFYIYDLGALSRTYSAWVESMPRVQPFYAVKCNPDPGILATLADLGAGFDCASNSELQAVLQLGVCPSRMIFANPAKFPRDLRFAEERGIPATFDSVGELLKIAAVAPKLSLVLRIRSDDKSASCTLGNKYGAELEEVPELLSTAVNLGLRITGVSFHVGSGARDPMAFETAIRKARLVIDAAQNLGFHVSLLDIGGGMTCQVDAETGAIGFNGFPEVITATVEALFPVEEGIRVIGEPGRCFAKNSAALVTQVFAKRHRNIAGISPREYWISDGIYGSFNCIINDSAVVAGVPLFSPHLPAPETGCQELHPSCVWGPTCDGLDVVEREVYLPELREGDWLIYYNHGAYTIASASTFNGLRVVSPHTAYFY
mmetsp:Transcript_14660/g.41222  ORF Transcript_14660/g.41222 Transcript_14660/m.41222 type:complete len:505 (-) Transcript_14660:251-1765(-)|eukprot:CAMPEP_0117661826 /NCGR_PEP_ID=MMETSP0804-20121206/7740_1 /TAXON_ID=1074897 /ORGANISM="Tetraselmis astigmatica, Strain CCMP880" /LENGTH=504 /DNA_ID=CAMNT_0005468711 /DNA_START=121 /DNA_END=1635 /DNA_ORIENTATION=-